MSSSADLAAHRPPSRTYHLLDPILGADPRAPDDYRRINLQYVQLGAAIMVVNALIEAGFNLVRQDPWLWLLTSIAAVGSIVFALGARRAQQRHRATDAHLVERFVIFALLCPDAAGYFIARGGHISSGYALAFLAVSAFFTIPPRRFVVIGACTYLLFIGWVSALPVPLFEKLVAIFNTGLEVLIGLFGHWSIDRIQLLSRDRRVRITQQNEALSKANTLLAQRNLELNDLMAIAAHDLRSPLFGLGSLLELARTRPPESKAELGGLLDASSRSVSAMLDLISRLLEAHEVEGRAPATLRRMDIARCLSAAIRRAIPQGNVSGVLLDCVIPPGPIWAMVDADGLDQILDNLISNAIRYSPRGTTVRASAFIASATAVIEIADQGLGIPETERETLFGKFRRGTTPPLHGSRGSGLGLYIVQTLAHAMGAHCAYRPAELRGSVFRLEFPLTAD